MAGKTTFGEVLREARERRGFDLNTAARRLHIRADILHAIEEGDFSRMPPRGYARSMIMAYARLVGVDPTDITRMYLDEANAYQVGRARSGSRSSRSQASEGRSARRRGNEEEGERRGRSQGSPSSGRERQTRLGRELYDDRRENTPLSLRARDRVHPSRHTALPGAQYTNFYAGPQAPNAVRSKLPFVVAGAVIVVLLIVVLVLVFGHGGKEADQEKPTVPITGLTDTSNQTTQSDSADASQSQPSVSVAPTKATFTYSVKSGSSAYIEVYENDGAASVAETVSGPSEKSFDVTGTLRFVTSNPESVELTVDGEKVTPQESGSSGVYSYTVDFQSILATWQKEHGASSASTSGTNSASGSATGTSSSTTSSTASASGTANSSSSSSSGTASGSASSN